MQIAQRYLNEIEEILDFRFNSYYEDRELSRLCEIVEAHWSYPEKHGGLFSYCKPIGTKFPTQCLTQIKFDHGGLDFFRCVKHGIGIKGWNGKILPELTEELVADSRIASDNNDILPEHLKNLCYPLTEEQKEEVRKVLLPYAEWQTRLRLHYQDTPVEELKLQAAIAAASTYSVIHLGTGEEVADNFPTEMAAFDWLKNACHTGKVEPPDISEYAVEHTEG